MIQDLTVVIPAKNESDGLKNVLPQLVEVVNKVIVVDDGSTDDTREYALSIGAQVVFHSQSKGNGAAVKTGIRVAETEFVAMMDGDGQHRVDDLLSLYSHRNEGDFDLVVGARDREGQASLFRYLANSFYNKFASWMVGTKVKDLTSGIRIFRTEKIKNILWLLPDKFSYPTTSTMVFYRLGLDVDFLPVTVQKRVGNSHINILKDGFRFVLIITKIGTLFSPFKLFVPASFVLFFLASLRYLYTFLYEQSFTNMSALLYSSSLIVFFLGVISEQLSTLIYSKISTRD